MIAATIAALSVAPGPAIGASAQDVSEQVQKPRVGACERESEKVLGQKAASIGGSRRMPKRIRHVSPSYPELPPGTVGSGMWLGEALVSSSGKVAHVWSIREVMLKPAFPPFNEAIVEAIRGWEYEPLVVDSEAIPFCMTVSVTIDWQ